MALPLLWVTPSLATSSCGEHEEDKRDVVRVYYLPFATGTFTPVTPENIEQKARHKVVVKDDSEPARTLQTLFNGAGLGTFNARLVRLKVSGLGGEVYYVDQTGNIRHPQNREAGLSEADFARIKALVESLL